MNKKVLTEFKGTNPFCTFLSLLFLKMKKSSDAFKTPAIPIDEFKERLKGTILSEADIRSLLRNPEFRSLQFRNEQVLFSVNIAKMYVTLCLITKDSERYSM